MLRVYAKSGTKNISRLYDSKHAIRTDPLHRLGEAFIQVSHAQMTSLSAALVKSFYQFTFIFSQLFGEHNEDEDVSPDTADPEAAASAGAEALEQNANEEGNVTRVSTRKWAQDTEYNPQKIFNKLFFDDIKYLLSMSDLWKKRTPPTPIEYVELNSDEISNMDGLNTATRDQKVWSLLECQSVFASSLNELKNAFLKLDENDHLVWDKDDKGAMDFVAACANVRATIFNIPQKSRFEIKCEL